MEEVVQLKGRMTHIEENNHHLQNLVNTTKAELQAYMNTQSAKEQQSQDRDRRLQSTQTQLQQNLDQVLQRVQAAEQATAAAAAEIRRAEQRVGTAAMNAAATATPLYGGSSTKTDLTGLKSVLGLGLFSGKGSEYTAWACKLRNALRKAPDLVKVIKWLDEQKEEPDSDDLEAYVTSEHMDKDEVGEWLDQLYAILIHRTEGSALHLIQGLEDEEIGSRGMRAWWKLKQAAMGVTGERLVGLSNRILNPPRCEKVSELQQAVDVWETWVRELESADGRLQESLKVSGLTKVLPTSMAKYVLDHGFVKYSELKRYVDRQIAQGRENWFPSTSASAGKGPSPNSKTAMDIGNFEEEMTWGGPEMNRDTYHEEQYDEVNVVNAKGGKGFNGSCHTCGQWGHRSAECRKGGSSGFQGYCNLCGKWGHRAADCRGGHEAKGKGKDFKGQKGEYKGFGKGFGKGKGKFGGKKGGFTGSIEGSDHAWEPPHLCSVVPATTKPASMEPAFVKVAPRTTAWKTPISNRFSALDREGDDAEDDESDFPSVNVLDMQWNSLAEGGCKTKKRTSRWRRVTQWQPLPVVPEEPVAGVIGALTTVPTTSASKSSSGCQVFQDSDQLNYLNSEENFVGNLDDEWEELESLMDSGATACVMDKNVGRGVPLEESEGSRAGQVYATANGAKIANEGKKTLSVVTENWEDYLMTYQCAKVVKPLTSVGSVCDAGSGRNQVTFTKHGGWIWHADQDKYTEFKRMNGAYSLRTWIRRPKSSTSGPADFQRQGA